MRVDARVVSRDVPIWADGKVIHVPTPDGKFKTLAMYRPDHLLNVSVWWEIRIWGLCIAVAGWALIEGIIWLTKKLLF